MLIIQIKQGNSLVVLKCKDIILLSLRGLGAVQMFSICINYEFVLRGAAFFKRFYNSNISAISEG